jgi:hypothetical protein
LTKSGVDEASALTLDLNQGGGGTAPVAQLTLELRTFWGASRLQPPRQIVPRTDELAPAIQRANLAVRSGSARSRSDFLGGGFSWSSAGGESKSTPVLRECTPQQPIFL